MPYLKSISRDACNPQGRAQVIIDVLNRSIAGMLYYLPVKARGDKRKSVLEELLIDAPCR